MTRPFRARRWLAAPLMLAAATAGAEKAVAPLPPFSNAYEPRSVDERGLWMLADEDERKLRDSAFVIRDPQLSGYVRTVLCRTVGADRCGGARVYVMRVPAMNAYMTPNGSMVIWSGLLLRVRDEAELAAILGHEFAHFEQRHTLGRFSHGRSMSDIAAWMSLFGGSAAATVQTAAIGSIFSYQRDQEQAADMLGGQYMLAAGYDARALPDIWTRTMDEADATSLGRKQRSRRYDRVAFFASHPTNLDRAIYLRKLADAAGRSGETGQSAFVTAMKPWRAEFLADQLKLNDFGGTEYLLGQLASDGWSEDLLFARGELYRTRGNPRDLVSAADFYRQAITQDPAHAEAYRGLGLSLMRSGGAEEGTAALKHYLALKPAAPDAAMIATLVTP
jgi:hypothetical protein